MVKNFCVCGSRCTKGTTLTFHSILDVPIPSSPTDTPKSKSSKSGTTNKKNKKEKPKPPEYIFFNLFEWFNAEKIFKYMPNVCQILQQAYLKTVELAKVYYGNISTIENIELPQSYNEFISGILQKFKYYYLQCLQAWAEEIQDFTMVTNDFLQFATQYCSNYLESLHEKQFGIFKEKQTAFFNNVENVITMNVAEIKNVHNMLKPLYGFHKNHQMLIDLNIKMNDALQLSKNNLDVSVEPFEEHLKKCFEEYKTTMGAANELVDDLESVLYDDKFCKQLIAQAKYIFKCTNTENFDIELDNIITYTDEELKTNSEAELSNIVENIALYYRELRTQIVQEEVHLHEEEMLKKKNNFSEILASMLKTWLIDMNKVTDLYTVKYE